MKVMKFGPNEKRVDWSQPEKQFRQDLPVSNELRDRMEEVHRDFTTYMMEHFEDVKSILKAFSDDLHIREEKQVSLETNLFWWKILHDSSQDLGWNCTDDFIAGNVQRFMDHPLLTSWLKEWDKAATKFYYVGHKYSDRLFFVIDSLEEKRLNVIVKDPEAVAPKEGEIVIGTLIPYGDGLYSPITDFYRFDYEAREVMGGTFRHYYDKYLKSDSLSAAFIHVLSVMLQIERRIYLKIKRVK